MFSPCYFHVIISIGILESNSLSLSTPSRTKWTLSHTREYNNNIVICDIVLAKSTQEYITMRILSIHITFQLGYSEQTAIDRTQ